MSDETRGSAAPAADEDAAVPSPAADDHPHDHAPDQPAELTAGMNTTMSAAQHDTDGVKSMDSIINTDNNGIADSDHVTGTDTDIDTADSSASSGVRGRHYRNDGETGQFSRILAQAVRSEGTTPQPRHRRYREDDEENEVLTRILGR